MKEKYKVAPDCIDAEIWTTKVAINSADEKRINTENTDCKWMRSELKAAQNPRLQTSETSAAVGVCDGCLEAHVRRLLADDWKTRSGVQSRFRPHRCDPQPLAWHTNTGAVQQRWCTVAAAGDSFLPSASLSKTMSSTTTVWICYPTFKQLKKKRHFYFRFYLSVV